MNQPSLSTLGLSACTKAVIATDKGDITLAVMALLTCKDHGGTHHFFVSNEGKMLCCSPVGIACLKKQGVKL